MLQSATLQEKTKFCSKDLWLNDKKIEVHKNLLTVTWVIVIRYVPPLLNSDADDNIIYISGDVFTETIIIILNLSIM